MSSRDDYVELLKSAALSMAKKEIMPLILSQLPSALTTGFLGSILTPVLGFIVGKVLEIAIHETEIGLFFLYIDLRTSAQGRDFEKTMRANLDAQKNGTLEQKDQAEKDLKDAFKAFIKLTN